MTEERMMIRFQLRVSRRLRTNDLMYARDWWEIAFGFFLALGATPERARDMADTAQSNGFWVR
jgi:hypothetical protein